MTWDLEQIFKMFGSLGDFPTAFAGYQDLTRLGMPWHTVYNMAEIAGCGRKLFCNSMLYIRLTSDGSVWLCRLCPGRHRKPCLTLDLRIFLTRGLYLRASLDFPRNLLALARLKLNA